MHLARQIVYKKIKIYVNMEKLSIGQIMKETNIIHTNILTEKTDFKPKYTQGYTLD